MERERKNERDLLGCLNDLDVYEKFAILVVCVKRLFEGKRPNTRAFSHMKVSNYNRTFNGSVFLIFFVLFVILQRNLDDLDVHEKFAILAVREKRLFERIEARLVLFSYQPTMLCVESLMQTIEDAIAACQAHGMLKHGLLYACSSMYCICTVYFICHPSITLMPIGRTP